MANSRAGISFSHDEQSDRFLGRAARKQKSVIIIIHRFLLQRKSPVSRTQRSVNARQMEVRGVEGDASVPMGRDVEHLAELFRIMSCLRRTASIEYLHLFQRLKIKKRGDCANCEN